MNLLSRIAVTLLTTVSVSVHADPIPTNAPEQNLQLLGIYGANSVGLYRNQDVCMITFTGHRDDNSGSSLAVWLPGSPVLVIYPDTDKISEALAIAETINPENEIIKSTNDVLLIQDDVHNLSTNNKNMPYNNLAARFDTDPKDQLLAAGTFVVLIKDVAEGSKGYSIGFGTKGLTDALAAYEANCQHP